MTSLNFRSKPKNLMPNSFETKTLVDELGTPTTPGPKSSPKAKAETKHEKKEKKERKPPKAKTPEQEAKNVFLAACFLHLFEW
jgi:hypothetical protein